MSHEGIRIVSAEDARRDSEQAARALPADSVTPAKIRVKQTEGTGVEIDWRDGHQSSWSFRWLRDACPCATCHEEREANGRAPGEPKPKPQAVFALYEAPPRPAEVSPIGRYALKFKWNDGHEAGLYSWEYLRRVCQCTVCRSTR
ncbi:MAG: DUF971 domain-containing protein [Acidobacteriota bacterium]|nr:DUF971 domain-containing protein [Acidobacteriota bacterium]